MSGRAGARSGVDSAADGRSADGGLPAREPLGSPAGVLAATRGPGVAEELAAHGNNLAELLRARAVERGWSGRVAFECGAERVAHGEVHERAVRRSAALAALGVRVGDRVVLVLDDDVDFVVLFLAVLRLGAVAVPVNPRLHRGELAACLAGADPALVVRRPQDVAGLAERTPAELDFPAPPAPAAELPDEHPAYALFTSGTTGASRLCPHAHADPLVHQLAFGGPVLRLAPDDVVHSVSKMYFAYGLGNSLLYPLLAGCRAVLEPGPAQAARALAIVDEHRVSVLFSVPTFYSRLLTEPACGLLAGLRLAVTAGEVLPLSLERRLGALLGERLLNGIGTTEVGQAFTSNAAGAHRIGTVGRALPPYAVRVVDELGAVVGADVVGRLQVRGPTVSAGEGPDGGPAREPGWYTTGDLASCDADGYLVVTGRADDIENVGGIKVHPADVESLLAEHPLVVEAAVCAVREGDRSWLRAYVVRAGGGPDDGALAEELLAAARAGLTAYKAPRAVVFVPALPRTGSGKLRRHVVRGWADR
ncbi:MULTISPECIES: AMP-binding protein [Actinosynnema]|uniref:AMP-binding protein n=1 Tax=Actinosynnema TaxID=40566 RepID=UPI0020A2CBA8|nr:AMP-binding protein [Actinosynnema pretiosum]MCP2096299.1 fatty acid CoA ligase FadD22 [Actinosynnema pretiosum]